MRRDRWIQIFAAIIMVASLVSAGWLMPGINATASDAQLKYTDEAAAGAPAAVVVAQSIGVVRGLIANYLWIRADKLKEEGKFFEAYQLSRWITQLQPRYASVWSFQAWNMAYNISVATHTREERWQWVRDGIQLMRNYGIRYNPSEMMLYRELAWFFLHKIDGLTDDANRYYKQQLADEWQGLLGEPPYSAEGRAASMKVIADAPDRWDRVVAQQPAAAELLKAIRSSGFELDADLLRLIESARAMSASPVAARMDLAARFADVTDVSQLPPQGQVVYRVTKLLSNPEFASAWPVVIAHTRKRVLLDEYNMDPSYMLQFMGTFGPLDWRCPAAHSLYWAAVGVERGLSRREQSKFDRVNTDRILFHSEQALTRNGRLYYDFVSKEISYGPDLRFIPYYEDVYVTMGHREIDEFGLGNPVTFLDGYRNFMIDSVWEYYMFGEYDKAQESYDKLRTDKQFFQPDKPLRFSYSIDDFILNESADRWSSINVATPNCIALLATAYRVGLARGDLKAYNANVRMARSIYDYFYKEVGNATTAVTPETGRLPFEWDKMLLQAFKMAMTDSITTMGERMALWERADDSIKQKTYDEIVTSLADNLKRSGLPIPFDVAFPPPPGMDAYRKQKELETQQGPEKPTVQIERK